MDAFIKKRLQHKQNVTTNVPQTVPEIFIFFKFYSMDTELKIIGYNLEIRQMRSYVSSIYFKYKLLAVTFQ